MPKKLKAIFTLPIFQLHWPARARLGWGDGVVILGLIILLVLGVRLGSQSEAVISGSEVSLSRQALPYYTALSLMRMLLAYCLSLSVAFAFGSLATSSRRVEKLLIPLVDVLQSVPILSFLPVVLLSLTAILPSRLAAEIASIILIFTCQAWNLILTWYQSMATTPRELGEVSTMLRLDRWQKFRKLHLPLATSGLIWNSMVSWASGWFFLMAAESFTLGHRDFRLPGLGSYLQEAASKGNIEALVSGMIVLFILIVTLDQLIWSPLTAWSERYRMEFVESDKSGSWFLRVLQNSPLAKAFFRKQSRRINEAIEQRLLPMLAKLQLLSTKVQRGTWFQVLFFSVVTLLTLYAAYSGAKMIISLPRERMVQLFFAVGATLLRVVLAISLALLWTIPLGVLIGSNRRLAAWLQPFVQILAAIPSTALFPMLLLILVAYPGGLNIAAIVLMMLGAQWYLLFNIIAGANAIPQDFRSTAALLQMNRKDKFRNLTLPALFPYIVTGGITASGGAWNASVVAEYTHFAGETHATFGIGAMIAEATATGDYALLLASTLSMIIAVVIINRFFWRKLFVLAEERYRLD